MAASGTLVLPSNIFDPTPLPDSTGATDDVDIVAASAAVAALVLSLLFLCCRFSYRLLVALIRHNSSKFFFAFFCSWGENPDG